MFNNEGRILTRAVLPVTSEAAETEAGVVTLCVDTLSKLAALVLPCLTFVHIYRGDGQIGRERRKEIVKLNSIT